MDVVLSGGRGAANGLGALERLTITGPLGSAPLGELAEVVVSEGPVTISRTDGLRSATITGDIVAEDTQAVGQLVDEKIAAVAAACRACRFQAAAYSGTSRRASRPSSSPWASA